MFVTLQPTVGAGPVPARRQAPCQPAKKHGRIRTGRHSVRATTYKKAFTIMNTISTIRTDEDALIAILKKSHADVLAGKTYSQEEAERFLDQRIYELRDTMVGTCVAEPC